MRTLGHSCFLLIVLGVFTILSACSKQTQTVNLISKTNQNTTNASVSRFDVAEFERNRNIWKSKNIENYKMIVEAHFFAFLSKQVLIEVENSKVKSIKNTSETDKGNPEPYKICNTVEKIFGLIERAKNVNATILDIEYDETLGYPTKVFIDERRDTADDEMAIEIKSLEINK